MQREQETLAAMIALYCHDLHAPADGLCAECATLREYARARLERCTFGAEKPKCSDCPIHCYKPAMREAIRRVMKYSGPRMMVKHPVMALRHVVDGITHPARRQEKAVS